MSAAGESEQATRGARRFGDAAEEYDRLRPAPSPEALDWLMSGRERVVLDLAAGTGQISRQLDRPGLDVVAVEPDDRMRALLQRRCPHARVLDGLAEDIPLPASGVDTVLVGSAWHWFDSGRALAEIARVLRPGGRLGVAGTVPDPFDPLPAELMGEQEAAELRARMERDYRHVDLGSAPFGQVRTHEIGFRRPTRAQDVLAELATRSWYLAADDDGKARSDAAARRALEPHVVDGWVGFPQRSCCWRTDRDHV